MTDDEGQEIPNVGVVPKKAPKVMNWTSPMSAMMLKGLSEVAARGAKTNKGYLREHKAKGLNFMKMDEEVRQASFKRILKANPDLLWVDVS
ncbi:hypothetical protein D1007_61303 [Hordeum vulgare]|nr:hypothetical protein D1007_61303 [Hordeum vulgare]